MYIIDKKLRNRDEVCYIICFMTYAEAYEYFSELNMIATELGQEYIDLIKNTVAKLKTRLNSSYTNENSECSTILYQNEMAKFAELMFLGMSLSSYVIKEKNKIIADERGKGLWSM